MQRRHIESNMAYVSSSVMQLSQFDYVDGINNRTTIINDLALLALYYRYIQRHVDTLAGGHDAMVRAFRASCIHAPLAVVVYCRLADSINVQAENNPVIHNMDAYVYTYCQICVFRDIGS